MNTMTNVDFIKERTIISETELQRLLNNIALLQREAKNKEREAEIRQRLEDSSYNSDYIKNFLLPYPYLIEYFSEEEILYACKLHFNKQALVKTEIKRGCVNPKYISYGKFMGYTMADFKDPALDLPYKDLATVILVPNDNQFHEGVQDMIRYLLQQRHLNRQLY